MEIDNKYTEICTYLSRAGFETDDASGYEYNTAYIDARRHSHHLVISVDGDKVEIQMSLFGEKYADVATDYDSCMAFVLGALLGHIKF